MQDQVQGQGIIVGGTRKARYTSAEREAVLQELSASGKSVKVFAQGRGLSPSTLFEWRRLAMLSRRERADFRPVRLTTAKAAGVEGRVVIRGPGSLCITVDAHADEEALYLALRALKRCG